MYLYNSPEYCETNFAAMKVRGVPININYRYLDDELRYLLDNADVEALVFHTSLGDRVARVRDRLAKPRGEGDPQSADTMVQRDLLAHKQFHPH
jgi:fatty-acyl-CoA synthase